MFLTFLSPYLHISVLSPFCLSYGLPVVLGFRVFSSSPSFSLSLLCFSDCQSVLIHGSCLCFIQCVLIWDFILLETQRKCALTFFIAVFASYFVNDKLQHLLSAPLVSFLSLFVNCISLSLLLMCMSILFPDFCGFKLVLWSRSYNTVWNRLMSESI